MSILKRRSPKWEIFARNVSFFSRNVIHTQQWQVFPSAPFLFHRPHGIHNTDPVDSPQGNAGCQNTRTRGENRCRGYGNNGNGNQPEFSCRGSLHEYRSHIAGYASCRRPDNPIPTKILYTGSPHSCQWPSRFRSPLPGYGCLYRPCL